MTRSIPMCHKCAKKQMKKSPKDAVKGVVPSVLVGCDDLSEAEWEEGWYDDGGPAGFHQHNCPLYTALFVKEESPVPVG